MWVGWFDCVRGAWVNYIGFVRVKLGIRNFYRKYEGSLFCLFFFMHHCVVALAESIVRYSLDTSN